MKAEVKSEIHPALEQTVRRFKQRPLDIPLPGRRTTLHATSTRKYNKFCRGRRANLYSVFLKLVGDDDLSWLDETVFVESFRANVPFPGKKNERSVQGGRGCASKIMHGIVRYEYKDNIIEECRKEGKQHGLRVVCTQMGHVWIRLYDSGTRLAQIVLNADLSEQSAIDDGGLAMLSSHVHLVRECFECVDT